MHCNQCGQQLNNDSLFCFKCGTKAPEPTSPPESGIFCIQCGEKLPEDATFCTSCGAKTPEGDNPSEANNLCPKCGQILNNDSEFCFSCGEKVVADGGTATSKPPSAAQPAAPASRPSAENITSPAAENEPLWDASQQDTDSPDEHSSDGKTASSEVEKQRKLTMILVGATAALLIVVVGLVLFIMIGRDSGSGNDDSASNDITGGETHVAQPTPQAGNEPSADDEAYGVYYIDRIQEGYYSHHVDVTIGDAFSSYFINYYWTHFSDETESYVSFHGDIMHEGEVVTAQIIFQFGPDRESFHPIMFFLAGELQDVMDMRDFIDNVMNNARAGG